MCEQERWAEHRLHAASRAAPRAGRLPTPQALEARGSELGLAAAPGRSATPAGRGVRQEDFLSARPDTQRRAEALSAPSRRPGPSTGERWPPRSPQTAGTTRDGAEEGAGQGHGARRRGVCSRSHGTQRPSAGSCAQPPSPPSASTLSPAPKPTGRAARQRRGCMGHGSHAPRCSRARAPPAQSAQSPPLGRAPSGALKPSFPVTWVGPTEGRPASPGRVLRVAGEARLRTVKRRGCRPLRVRGAPCSGENPRFRRVPVALGAPHTVQEEPTQKPEKRLSLEDTTRGGENQNADPQQVLHL